jgi:hypothetical protein
MWTKQTTSGSQDGYAAVITPAIQRSFQLPTPLLRLILGTE